MNFQVQRECAGFYRLVAEFEGDQLEAIVERRDDLGGWMASASWDNSLYTDVLPTYRSAKFNAASMIGDEVKDRERRLAAGQAND